MLTPPTTSPESQDVDVSERVNWQREAPTRVWDPSRRLLRSIRAYQYWRDNPSVLSAIPKSIAVLRHRFWSVVTGAEIPLNCQIDGGLLIPHPNGIVIHPEARIGPNCLLLQQVTLGTGGKIPGAPQLGLHVDVGAGAKILGGVRIGAFAKVGANAVVLDDIPPGATAVGIPTIVKPSTPCVVPSDSLSA